MTKPKYQKCLCCKQPKKLSEYYRNGCGTGRTVVCKECTDRAAGIEKQIETENAGTTRATPRTFISRGLYTPDTTTYYRNNGNKHIPSRGFA